MTTPAPHHATSDQAPAQRTVAELVDTVRPGPGEASRVGQLIERLEREPALRERLGDSLRRLATGSRCVHALTTSGILPGDGFIEVTAGMVARRLLPEIREPDDLHAVIRALFPRRQDTVWVDAIPEETAVRLLELLGLAHGAPHGIAPELGQAIQVLAHRVGGLGLRPEITDRMPWIEVGTSPFLILADDTLRYLRSHDNAILGDEPPLLGRLLGTLAQCRAAVVRLREEKHLYGTSLKLTALTHRLLQLIDRLELLLQLTEPVGPRFARSVVRLVRTLIRAECTRDSLIRHAQDSADLLLFRVVEHAARKGDKFIAATRGEYLRFLVSSMGGGLIVGVFALFKVLVDAQKLSPGPEALLFSANYALCFMLIHLTGSTLATKQPAVTAHALARCMGDTDGSRHLDPLVETITRVWRTQFVSFLGNLVCAFPMGFATAALYRRAVGVAPATGAKAESLLAELHPWSSGSLYFAAIAGVFLFSAGLVSGWVDNSSHHSRVPARVAHHPLLLQLGGPRLAEGLSRFVDRHLGALVGNAWLGLCLGAAGTFGMIFGLPFDIRHIAFASAHFAMAVEGLDHAVPASTILLTTFSVSAIGFTNFLVSFSLALFIAVESRRISFGETGHLFRLLLRRVRTRPADFFYPPAQIEPGA